MAKDAVMKPVAKYEKVGGLCEIGQQNLTQFCLARYDVQKNCVLQVHQFVNCRDFMGDVFVGLEDNRDIGIYGFSFTKNNPKPDMETCGLLVKFPDAGALTNFQDNFQILKNIEDTLGWQTTFGEVVEFPGEKRVMYVIGDTMWQANAPTFALYSYLLKCLTYPIKDKGKWMEEIKAQSTNEGRYMDVEYMKWLLVNLNEVGTHYKNFSGFSNQKEVQIGTLHNWTGFVSMKKLLWDKPEALGSYYTEMYKTHTLSTYKRAA